MFKNQHLKLKRLRWTLLILISMSVSSITFHSHHQLQWNITHHHHQNASSTLKRDASYCPYAGYLFGAKIVKNTTDIGPATVLAHFILLSQTQWHIPFYGKYNGRSPPLVG